MGNPVKLNKYYLNRTVSPVAVKPATASSLRQSFQGLNPVTASKDFNAKFLASRAALLKENIREQLAANNPKALGSLTEKDLDDLTQREIARSNANLNKTKTVYNPYLLGQGILGRYIPSDNRIDIGLSPWSPDYANRMLTGVHEGEHAQENNWSDETIRRITKGQYTPEPDMQGRR
jgi:hypothetical protein